MSEQILPVHMQYVKTEPVSTTGDTDSAESWPANSAVLDAMNAQFTFQLGSIKTENGNLAEQFSSENYVPGLDEEELYNYPSSSISSRVWNFFMFRKKNGVHGPPVRENLDMEYTICIICKRAYKFIGNTTNMQTHLKNCHQEIWESNEQPRQREARITSASIPKSSVPRYSSPSSNNKKQPIQEALTKFVVTKYLPFELVDDKYFREYSSLLDSKFDVPSSDDIATWVSKKQWTVMAELKNEIALLTDVSVTYDNWTTLNDDNFVSVMAHFISRDWQLREVLLQVFRQEGEVTLENEMDVLQVCKNYWLPRADIIGCGSSDAFKKLKWTSFDCFGMKINLIVRKGLSSSDEVSSLIAKGRNLLAYVKQSPAVTGLLSRKQTILFQEGDVRRNCIFKQGSESNWNDTCVMLKVVTEQRPAIMAVAMDENSPKDIKDALKNWLYSLDEQNTVEQIVSLLSSFSRATLSLCAEEVPTMHKVLPVIIKLIRILKEDVDDSSVVAKFKRVMRNELRSIHQEDDNILLLATVLNPFTKSLTFLPEDQQKKAKNILQIEMEKVMREDLSGQPVAKKVKRSVDDWADIDDWMSDIISEPSAANEAEGQSMGEASHANFKDETYKTRAESEINHYLNHTIHKSENPSILPWWSRNNDNYPNISKLARKYLCIPASSVPSETVFKLAQYSVTKKELSLHSKDLNTYLFLNKNMKYYW